LRKIGYVWGAIRPPHREKKAMPKSKRIKTPHPGVFYIVGTSKKTGKQERIYYIRYRKNGNLIEETVGRQFQDAMNPKKVSMIRAEIIEGAILSSKEIGKQIKAEKDLEFTSEKARKHTVNDKLLAETWFLFLESTTDGFSLYDSELNLIMINEAGAAMIPSCDRKEEIIGKNLLAFSPESKESGVYEKLQEVIKTGEPFSIDGMVPSPNHGYGENVEINIKAFKVGNGLGMIVMDITDRKLLEKTLREREKELEIKNINLEDANMALKVMLRKREADKKELEDNVLLNIKELVEPYLEKLKMSRLDERQKDHLVGILEANLKDIVAPFSQTLSSRKFNLTPMEIKVANLVKHGKTTQEIANILNVAYKTVCFHRSNIREKIGIKNRRSNLRSHLFDLS
jgi:DNA-binding CsgD family transcriptional regulator